MEIAGIIYKITNLINGKIYIGQTTSKIEHRMGQHKSNKRTIIGKAIQKYAWENFKVDVVEECSTSEELNEREQFWIAYYDCKTPKGYNRTDGGETVAPCTEEKRKKLSKAQQKRFSNPAEHEKLSQAQKKYFATHESPAKGRKVTEETRKKQSLAQKKRFASEKARKQRSLAQIKYYEEHPEVKEKIAATLTGRKASEEVKQKESLSQKKRHQENPMSEETKKKISNSNKGRKRKPLSEEHKKKISQALKGRTLTVLTSEARKKISEALKKHHQDPVESARLYAPLIGVKFINKTKDKLEGFNMDIMTAMKDNFKDCFGNAETGVFFSPGRTNIVGEHTDYNFGHVFPCAITLGTYALVADRTDNKTRIFSMNLADKGIIEFSMSGNKYDRAKDWANYPIGVVDVFEKAGYKAAHGFDIVLYGTLPNGAGLSSSASIEVLMAVILNDAFNFGIDMVEMVKMSQKAENEFVGVNCGIMDQFAVGLGKKNCAILLDCNTLKYSYAPLVLDGYSIVITNTNKKHSLSSSAYNQRRKQCENALKQLQTVKPDLKYLCDLTKEEFDEISNVIEDPLEKLRARHAVYENQRTLEAVEKLKQGDLVGFGKLLNDSHVSLRDDYDVTGEELDTLAELAWKQEGVLGSRMTGAGFGGCTISIVKNEAIEAFKKDVASGYTKRIGYEPSFYVANIADGTHKI